MSNKTIEEIEREVKPIIERMSLELIKKGTITVKIAKKDNEKTLPIIDSIGAFPDSLKETFNVSKR